METPRSSQEFKPTRTSERAQDLISRLERGLSWQSVEGIDGRTAPWELYRDQAEKRFNAQHEQPASYLATIARVLSVEEYPASDDQLFLELNRLPLRPAGRAFIDAAKVTYCLREDQLRETLSVGQRHPRRIPAVRDVRGLNLMYAGELTELSHELRQLGHGHYEPSYWAQPLADFILPLADTSKLRRDEVNLGVGIGLMLAYESYRPAIQRQRKRESKLLQAMLKASGADSLSGQDMSRQQEPDTPENEQT